MTFMLRAVGDPQVERERVLSVEPQAGFAIKTTVEGSSHKELQYGVKYFINVCHASQVPTPDVPFDPSIVFPLIMANRWEIPIVTSAARQDVDKKGTMCYVSDCCVNTECLEWARRNPQLKEILVEWCLESCELRQEIELSRTKLAFPKLRCKGDSIPVLEVLSEDLNADPQKSALDGDQDRSENDPQVFLDMRRDLMDNEEDLDSDGKLPPLFPNAHTEGRKVLIEEIEPSEMTLSKQKETSGKHTKQPLELDVRMGPPPSGHRANLRIQVRSELTSQQDYQISYDAQENTLNITTSPHHHTYQPQKLQIPLPPVTKSSAANMVTSFDRDNRTLSILL
ncbi:LAFA_0E13014g1_1 [Lachancea sp. 'fantastica']|nr:LAFA_0E13014g1_1 [Lachancea sp. 'fantastica']